MEEIQQQMIEANRNKLPFIKACYGYGCDQDWTKVTTYQEVEHFSEIEQLIK